MCDLLGAIVVLFLHALFPSSCHTDRSYTKSDLDGSVYPLAGTLDESKVELHFCSMDNPDSSPNMDATGLDSLGQWPAGSYCIYKRGGQCPDGELVLLMSLFVFG